MPDNPQELEFVDEESTRPLNWPGIPGRSLEHDTDADCEVTRAQRDLERWHMSPNAQREAKTQE